MIIWRCVNDWWVLVMMFIIVRCIFSFVWIVWLYVLLSRNNVDVDEYLSMNVDNGHDYVLVLIKVMFVNNHDDACWIIMMMMFVNYVHICAYMLLVNFLTCYWRWHNGVSMYLNMLVLIVEVLWTYALLLSSHMCMHPYSWWWWILCIQLFGVIMICSWHHRVTTSDVIWYHMHVGVVSRRITWFWHVS